MSAAIDETIKEIAVRHSVVLSKDDPILILQTMNERLLEETRKAQQEMLAQFKEEMESISSQWKDDAKEKAEKVLNVALAESKGAMAKLLQESTSGSVQAMKKMISDSLAESRDLAQQTQKFSRFALSSSIVISIGFVLTCVVYFLR